MLFNYSRMDRMNLLMASDGRNVVTSGLPKQDDQPSNMLQDHTHWIDPIPEISLEPVLVTPIKYQVQYERITPASTPVGIYYSFIPANWARAKNYVFIYEYEGYEVTQALPEIAWPTPAAINYGAPLTEEHFQATAGIPGSFAYSHAAGIVLDAGTHNLTVTFTPTDTRNQATVILTGELRVRPSARATLRAGRRIENESEASMTNSADSAYSTER